MFYINFSSIYSYIVISFPQSPANNLFLLWIPLKALSRVLLVGAHWYLQNSSSTPLSSYLYVKQEAKGRDFLPRSMPRERADRTWSKKLKYCYLRRGTLEMWRKGIEF